ncbi:MAG: substrate-binding domain-containing protein [Planctomycetota bacterium]|jgi:LacI family transcriptional regulator
MARKSTQPDDAPRKRVLLATVWLEPTHKWGIARYAQKQRWIFDSAVPSQIECIRNWKGDGIICQLHPDESAFVTAVRRLRAPKVELSNYVPKMRVPRVMPDFAACGRAAADHFLERNFRNHAVLYENRLAEPWMDGFAKRVRAGGGKVWIHDWRAPEVKKSGYKPSDQRRWLTDRLIEMPKPLAVMCQGFSFAVEVLDSCEEAGLVVPDQVAIVALTEDEMLGELAPVPLTTITPDYEEQAHRASQILAAAMDGKSVKPETIGIAPRPMIVRQSSDITAVRDPDVARAVMFIRHNLRAQDLWVPEVVKATNVSRRSLERAFQDHLGRSITVEIRRLRLERAIQLLRDTSMTAIAIADACGYPDAKQLRRVLARAVKMTPRQYRKSLQT